MKILIATPLYPPDIGGPATYAKILADELPKRGIEVSLVSFSEVRHLPKGIAHLVYCIKLFRAVRGCDRILALDPVSVGFPAALLSVVTRVPLVVKIVGDYAWEQGQQRYGVKQTLDEFVQLPTDHFLAQVGTLRTVEHFVARHATGIIVPSRYLKGIVCTWGVKEEHITVVYNAFDGATLSEDKASLRKKLSLTGTVLLSAGRLVPWKGFGTLISLMRELRVAITDVQLLIAGSGPLLTDLQQRIKEAGCEEMVTLLGNVPHETLLEYVAASDVFVLNTGYEGLSHQLLEVLSTGTPIVTTNVGGNPELIEDRKTGLLVPYDDREALLVAIKRVLEGSAHIATMTRSGKEFVKTFSTERMIAGTIEVLAKSADK